MQAYILLSFAVFASLSYQGACKEITEESNNNDVTSSTSSDAQNELSRAKRESLRMLRLGRGLHMLRLGKRGDNELPEDDVSILNERLQELINDQDMYPYDDLDTLLQRYRRATPPSDGVISPDSLQKGSSEFSDIDSSNIDENGFYEYLPNELLEDNLEDYLLRQEDGLGSDQGSSVEKRPMAMLRLGKRDGSDSVEDEQDFEQGVAKRTLSMLRLGKRPMDMLRLGKRPMSMLRLGKRPMSMLRLGKRGMSSMLRLGKRPMDMLRLGKRPMSMLRLGKRPMSMLRLGKRGMSSMLRLGKRPMDMLRLGKRPMSMLRLGKRESEEKEKRPMSMLRLGKRSAQ